MRIGRNWLRAAAVLGLLASGPAMAQVFKAVNFGEHPKPAKIAYQGTEVVLTAIAEDEGLIKSSAAITVPGYPALTVAEDEVSNRVFDRWVGIGKLAATDAAASVLLQGFTGGAHCCATLTVVTPWKGALKALTFDVIDGSGMEAFPTDIDGDGVVDFYRQDDLFRYQFASGAGSYSPPVLFNIREGALVNVSSEPRFAAFWEDYAKETRALCADQESEERNSPCAAYVVAGIHLGRFDAAMRDANTLASQDMSGHMPDGCTVAPVDDMCPEGKEMKFGNFEAALRYLLKRGKYLD